MGKSYGFKLSFYLVKVTLFSANSDYGIIKYLLYDIKLSFITI